MKQRKMRVLLSMLLAFCMILSAVMPVAADINGTMPLEAVSEQSNDSFLRIFHLDCGRKYFTVKQIEDIIDELAENHYTHIELAFGNDGLRFLLDDMSVTVNGKTYDTESVTNAIKYGNVEYSKSATYSTKVEELTQSEMDTIIKYANDKNIGVIPMFDVPGHMYAVIDAMKKLDVSVGTPVKATVASNVSQNMALDMTASDSINFVKALVKKYITYFGEKGSYYFNFGADECGFSEMDNTEYTTYAEFVNDMAAKVKEAGMTPMVFNDGIDYVGKTTDTSFNTDMLVCYWTEGTNYAKSTDLAKRYKLINTNVHWYYVLGNDLNSTENMWQFGYAKNSMKKNKCTICDGGATAEAGCMFAVWCDVPNIEYSENNPSYNNVKDLISTLATSNSDQFKESEPSSGETTPPDVGGTETPSEKEVNITVGESITFDDIDANSEITTEIDKWIAEAKIETKTTSGGTAYNLVTDLKAGTYYISSSADDTNPTTEITLEAKQNNIYYVKNGSNYIYPSFNGVSTGKQDVTVSSNGDGFTFYRRFFYLTLDNGKFGVSRTSTTLYLYEKKEIPGTSTPTLTIKGTGEGTTTVTISGVKYTINVTAQSETTDKSMSFEASFDLPKGAKDVKVDGAVVTYDADSNTIKSASTTGDATVTFVTKNEGGKVTARYTYNITVTAEDLSNVDPLPIQLWITNNTIEASGDMAGETTGDWNGTYKAARYINISPSTLNESTRVNSKNGMSLVDAFAAEGMSDLIQRYEEGGTRFIEEKSGKPAITLAFWTGRIHNSSDKNIQKVWDPTDYSSSGDEFKYVRYYDGSWSVSNDQENWKIVTGEGSTGSAENCTQQLAAYYMCRTKVTDEVTTDIADWGNPEGSKDYSTSGNYVLLDFAVKYEDNTLVPNSFPVSSKTMQYHCNKDTSPVKVYNGNYYRQLNNFRAVNSDDYEVYMVTVTITNDQPNSTISNTSSYTYNGEEQIVWAIDEETKTNSGFNEYVSISGSSSDYSECKIGGNPDIRGVEVYNKHGALITYYVRSIKANLNVHYLKAGTNEEFYSYGITVRENVKFDQGFALEYGKLINNTVVNNLGKTQTVSTDLTTLPAVPAQYRYSKFMCVEAERSANGEDVYLYYTFDSDVKFVVDFGLPFVITPSDINTGLSGANITSASVTYTGKAVTFDTSDPKNIKVTPNVVIDGTIMANIEYSGDNTGDSVKYNIEILPASNIYYEETFLTNNSGWESIGTATSATQKAEKLDESGNYGYDQAYENSSTYSNGSALRAKVYVAMPVASRPTASFTFTGTGFDIVSECSDKTGVLFVRVTDNDGNYEESYLVDTYFEGNNEILTPGSTMYQIPVVRSIDSLKYGTHNVTITGVVFSSSGVSTLSEDGYGVDNIFETLFELGITDEELMNMEFIYMDENSILNGGSGASMYVADGTSDASNTSPTTAEVYVDGFRVYNTLTPQGERTTSIQYSNDTDDTESGFDYVSVYENLVVGSKYHFYVETNGNIEATADNITNYKKQGPENEVYIVPGAAIAFKLDDISVESIQISAKSLNGAEVDLNGKKITSNTEMYYTINETDDYFVISNTNGKGVLAVSEIKMPAGTATTTIDASEQPAVLSAINTLRMSAPTEPVKPVEPEVPVEPEIFEPDYLEVYALPVAFRKSGSTITVTSSVEDGMEVYIESASGEAALLTPVNTRMVEWGITDKYIYTYKTGKLNPGSYTYSVYAVKDGVRSESVEISFIVW